MNDSLYIIGNGFDLHHGLQCSFADFKNWLQYNETKTYELMRQYYKDIDDDVWWSHFEESIGKFNYIFPPRSSEIEYLYEMLDNAFVSWIKELENVLLTKDSSLTINKNTLFLNFNYTSTLEKIYGVDSNLILHIHGSIKNDEPLVYGGNISHGKYPVIMEDVIGDILDGDVFEVDKVVCSHNKNVYTNIVRHQAFFNKLQNLKEIHVYGFSFSEIDGPYIKQITETSPNAYWCIYYHTDVDRTRFEHVRNECGIKEEMFNIVRW